MVFTSWVRWIQRFDRLAAGAVIGRGFVSCVCYDRSWEKAAIWRVFACPCVRVSGLQLPSVTSKKHQHQHGIGQ